MSGKVVILLAGCLVFAPSKSGSQTLNVPPRAPDAPTGSQFAEIITPMTLAERENWIYAQVLNGNIPDFQRALVPITVTAIAGGTGHTLTYYAAPDYLAIGTDTDYFLEPTTPLLAQRLCDALGCTLPTRRMANQIWTNAAVKMAPQPIPPSAEMITVPVFAQENNMVRAQRDTFTNAFPLGALVAGDKKDVIISSKIYTNFSGSAKPVVIYGWHYQNGVPIQPLYNGHEETYADYSHGVRLIQNAVTLDGSPNTVTNILATPSLAALLSDEGTTEGTTSDHVIRIPRYTIAGLPPLIINQPRSQSVLPGANPALRVLAAADTPLSYRWQRNGISLPGATQSTLIISNAQPADAGNYTVVVTNALGSAISRKASLRLKTNDHQVLFADDFDSGMSGNWDLFWGAANDVADYTVDWAFDYGTTLYTFNGITDLIPPAPNSPDGSRRAVRLSVNNNDALGATAAVNLYTRGKSFSGNFAVKLDLWINYPGGAGGVNSTGSTQYAIFGLNHAGTRVNWAAPSAAASDGLWFAVDGEGGSSTTDYRAYQGNPSGVPFDLTAAGTSGLAASNNSAAFYQALFPASAFETAGAPGKSWVEVELRQTNNVISWLMNGTVVAARTNTSAFSSGDIMIGFMDPFASIANPARDAFCLFDNLRVESLDAPPEVRFLSASLMPDGRVRLLFSGVPGQGYLIQTSTNFLDWQPLMMVTAAHDPVTIVDPYLPVFACRYYRARAAGL